MSRARDVASGNLALINPTSDGNLLTASSGAWVSQAPAPAPPAGNQVEMVASGTLADGSAVILQSDGTVKVPTGVTGGLSSETTFDSNNATLIRGICYHSSEDKIVIGYSDVTNSTHGKLVAGSISGSTITFGTPITYNSAYTNNTSLSYDANANLIVVAYEDTPSQYGTLKTYSLSGTTFTAVVGATRINSTQSMGNLVIQYDPDEQKSVAFWRRVSQGNRGAAAAITVTNSSISVGSIVEFGPGSIIYDMTCVYNTDANHHVAIYRYSVNNFPYYTTLTLSGTTLTAASEAVCYSQSIADFDTVYDPNTNKIAILFQYAPINYEAHLSIGTPAGTAYSFTFPSNSNRVSLSQEESNQNAIVYDPVKQKLIAIWRGTDNAGSTFTNNARAAEVEITSSTTITVSTPESFETTNNYSYFLPLYYSSGSKLFVAFRDQTNTAGKAGLLSLSSTDLTASNFLGFSNGAYTNGQTATIQTSGNVDDAQSGLVINTTYFVQNDGSLGTSASAQANVTAGKAIAATKILIA